MAVLFFLSRQLLLVLPLFRKRVCCLLSSLFNSSIENPDFIDEALELFRANVLFSTFDIKTPADRTMIFCILYISFVCSPPFLLMQSVLAWDAKVQNSWRRHVSILFFHRQIAERVFYMLRPRQVPLPGSSGYSLNKIFPAPQTKEEAGICCVFWWLLFNRQIYQIYESDSCRSRKEIDCYCVCPWIYHAYL